MMLKLGNNMQLDSPQKLTITTLLLHWLVSLIIMSLLTIGVYMVETETIALYSWHKSFGFLVFFIALIRIAWRIHNGWPTPVGTNFRNEQILKHVILWILIIGTFLLPLSGFLMSSLNGYGVKVFGFELISRNTDPNNLSKVLAYNRPMSEFFKNAHHLLSYMVILAISLHITGALKHHFINKDATLRRMLKQK